MKTPRPPAPAPASPPVRASGSEMVNSKARQMKKEKKRKGILATELSDASQAPATKPQLLG